MNCGMSVRLACLMGLLSVSVTMAGGGHWRGPEMTGVFETASVPAAWSPDGDMENVRWSVDIGSRSAPLVMNGHVYLLTRGGSGETLQERVVCLDEETGSVLWEHRFNVFLTDIVELRVGWANLAGDPATGLIYAHGVQGTFICFDAGGRIVWQRSLTEEFGRISGYGGRTHTPVVAGDLVIISFLNSSWGPQGKGAHRFLAMNKYSGEVCWWAQPGETPLDTTYSVPVLAKIDDEPLLFTGLADGSIVALNSVTGVRKWRFPLSKRGINTSVVYGNGRVYASHSEENMDSIQMGRVVCLDARTGTEIWRVEGLAAGYASPVLTDDVLYVVANSANLHALDPASGAEYWNFNYGTEAKGSPVMADGKMYVGEVKGRYRVLKVSREGCEPLSEAVFSAEDGSPVEIFGTPAASEDSVILPTYERTYCVSRRPAAPADDVLKRVRHLGLVPAEAVLGPGESLRFQVCGYDAQGRPVSPLPAATFALEGLDGSVDNGVLSVSPDARIQAGRVTATLGDLAASSRIRVFPELPYREDFDGLAAGTPPPGWITSRLKVQVADDGNGGRLLRKLADRPAPAFARLRCYMMPPMQAGYTVQADMLGVSKKKRFIPDMGLINCRYLLVLTGTTERTRMLRLVSWAPIPRIQKEIEFDWLPDTWYTVKLTVETGAGTGRVRGKVWPRGTPEPAEWTLEMEDPVPNESGSPGLYAYSVAITASSPGTEVLYDNVEVTR